MQPTTSNNDSRPIVLYHVHKQAGFEYTFINGRGFKYLKRESHLRNEDDFHVLSI